MTPRYLLPADARTFETQSHEVSLVVQESLNGEVYYRFAAPSPEAPAETLAQETLLPLADTPLTVEV